MQAQNFSENPDEFGVEIKTTLEKSASPQIIEWAKNFYTRWEVGALSTREKKALAQATNRYLKKGMRLPIHLLHFLDIALALKEPETRIRVPVEHFIAISESVYVDKGGQGVTRFWEVTRRFIGEGIVQKTSVFQWRIGRSDGRLQMMEIWDSVAFAPTRVPVFVFGKTDLICQTGSDTHSIAGTQGALNLLDRRFYGRGGKVDWRRLGLDPQKVYAQLDSFTLNMNVRKLQASRVRFHYEGFLPNPLVGNLVDDFTTPSDPKSAKTPYFRSTEGIVEIRDFIPNTLYRGGFSLRGVTKLGSAVGDTLATLMVYAQGRPVMLIELEELALNPDQLKAQDVAVKLFLPGRDTIFYPSTDLVYEVQTQDILLLRNRRNPKTRQGFYSSYHRCEMLFDALRWNPLKDTTIQFSAIVDAAGKWGIVQSEDFYSQKEFDTYRDILPFHPLGIIYRYMQEKAKRRGGRKILRWSDIMKAYNLDPRYEKAAEKQLKELETYGFLRYDAQLGIIEPLPKLIAWAKAARAEKDYDAIRILSNTPDGKNGALDLSTKKLTLHGVEVVVFSDSHIVEIAPYQRTVYVEKNRNMRFAGRLAAGKTDLFVKPQPKFFFDYENFRIDLQNIDSLKFRPDRDPLFRRPAYQKIARSLRTLSIENVSGAIYIDEPHNKNGRNVIPYYSILDCYTNSFKYWNSPRIQNGHYDRKRLYFELDPFMIDSLETFNLLNLEFHGVFHSDSIFPDFRDTLKVVPDNTYGVQEVFAQGIPVYKGKGKFYQRVAMDNFGLHGRGILSYLTSQVRADTFVFHFDSVMAQRAQLLLPRSSYGVTEYIDLQADSVYFVWYPYKDRVVIRTLRPAKVFAGEGRFLGELAITSSGVSARGLLELGEVEIESQTLTLKPEGLQTQEGTFRVRAPQKTTEYLFVANGVSVSYNVKNHEGNFTSLTQGLPNMEFPRQNLATSLGKGSYLRESGELFLASNTPNPEDNYAVVKSKGGKELVFNTQVLQYNLRKQTLEANRVDSILVADAVIYPEGGRVSLSAEGKFAPLENATIAIPPKIHNHRILDAQVTIESAVNYTAQGRYRYAEVEGKKQFIEFAKIYVGPDSTTRAYAIIPEDKGFLLTDRILFRDSVELVGKRKFLRFSGEVRIQSQNEFLQDSWFTFSGIVNPDTIFIPIQNPRNKKGQELTVGLHYFPLYRTFYTNFLQPKRNKDDIDVLLAEGGLSVDRQTKAFRIGPQSKIEGRAFRGNVVVYDDAQRITTAYGRLNFPAGLPQGGAQMYMAGSWTEEQRFQKLSTNLLWILQFSNLPTSLVDAIGSRFNLWALSNDDIDFQDPTLLGALAEALDPDPAQPEKNIKDLLAQIQKTTYMRNVKVASYLPQTWIFTGVNFHRSDSTGALYVQDSIGVCGIGGTSVNKKTLARIEYVLGRANPAGGREADVLEVYLEPAEGNWIYFVYSGYYLKMLTSDSGINRQIRQAAEKQKDYNKDPNKPKLQLLEATPQEKEQFVERFSAYLLSK
ncbi:MAG: hypothetical protein ACUVRD_08530 [Bacteroidia bacterium]